MLITIAIGTGMIILNMVIQILAVAMFLSFFQRRVKAGAISPGTSGIARMLSIIMLFLLMAHLVQFATWAALFMGLGEFQDFETAFYHSTVNFTSLGYGDIVMSERWRLLGGLEAANGVLMFGLSAGLILSTMNAMLKRRGSDGILNKQNSSDR